MSTMQAVEVIISKLRDRKGFDSAFDLDDDILAEIKQEMADIIEAYAADLREREAAKEGVTDEVVERALKARVGGGFSVQHHMTIAEGSTARATMRAALEAVWPVKDTHAERPVVPDVDEMVNRFLAWRLPDDFYPDAGVSFDRTYADACAECWPIGTNLLTAAQAKQMILHLLAAAPQPPQEPSHE